MAEERECPVGGCENRHDRSKLMCRGHWFQVPKQLRGRLWAAYRGPGILSEEYFEAREACIAAVEMEQVADG